MELILACASLVFLFWFFYWPWQSYCVDVARQRMFMIRDELFDLAADEKMSFNEPAYQEMRDIINANIRFAHRMSWIEIFLVGVAIRGERAERHSFGGLLGATKTEDARNKVGNLQRRLSRIALSLIIFRSPFLASALLGISVLGIVLALLYPAPKLLIQKMISRLGELVVTDAGYAAS